MNPTTEDPIKTSTLGLSRRTLVKNAAWSLPVIAIAIGAPAQAASGVTSNARISFDNFNFSNRGKQMNAQIQFDYVDWQFKLFLTSISFTILLPRASYSGALKAGTSISGAHWTMAPAVARDTSWLITFTYVGTLNQSNSTSQLVALWATLPDTDTQGAPPGTVVPSTAYGALSDGTTTPVIARSADFW